MKKHILFLVFAAAAMVSCRGQASGDVPDFVHATYSVAGWLTAEELANPGYEDYDFIYLMGAPAWWEVDFSRPESEVLQKADAFSYAALDGGMKLTPEFIDKAHEAGTKVLLCFGGTDQFIPLLKDPSQFGKLAAYMVRIAGNNGYDGIDIDWELTVDKKLHAEFMHMLRNGLDSLSLQRGVRMYLTTALGADMGYDRETADRLSGAVDWINVMTYDMGDGYWGDTPGHNTSMPDLKFFLGQWDVFSRDKICVGLASYGYYYKGAQPGVKSQVPLKECTTYIGYNDLLRNVTENGWTEEYDGEADVPYYFSPDRKDFVTIENKTSMRKKIEWIVGSGYKGVFWWEYHYDYILPEDPGQKSSHHLEGVVMDYLETVKK